MFHPHSVFNALSSSKFGQFTPLSPQQPSTTPCPQPLLVADFGLSEYEECLSAASPVCGTATYLAPEVGGDISQSLLSHLENTG